MASYIGASHVQLATDLSGLLQSGKNSDCIIKCGLDKYNVHKAIVDSRSEFLALALDKNPEDGVLDLSEDDPDTVKLMIDYMYSGAYEPKLDLDPSWFDVDGFAYDLPYSYYDMISPPVTIHAKLYAIANKYNVSGLGNLASHKFAEACAVFWESPEFMEAARYVYESTPDGDMNLRDIVSHTISEHMNLITTPEIEQLLQEANGLAYGILKVRLTAWMESIIGVRAE